MEEREAQASSFYKPSLGDEGGGGSGARFDQSVRELELKLMNVDQCETIGDLDDSQLVGAAETIVAVPAGADGLGMGKNGLNEVKLAEKSVEKRKRGRPPRGQGKAVAPVRKKKDEEDVCFICFDGGSLVLCDRRGCPKAYHPACIKRDDAFFRSRAKWNCGWHICSTCQKASHYMCYTCTYSLCKGCTKDADYVCVRGNKGFCQTCMRTIMLIEKLQVNKEAAQVDFDDKSSWEYLFKVYWVLLKDKLSLNIDELLKAKNPWKGPALVVSNMISSFENYGGNDDKSLALGNSCPDLVASNAKRRKIEKNPNVLTHENCLHDDKSGSDIAKPIQADPNWASKELLEFVAHMRNGDTSAMTQFDVQTLLLEYIKTNKLRDPRQKCQIVCDSRLLNMFGKARVGHFEMLKLLEYHFLVKEECPVNNAIMKEIDDSVGSQMESDQNCHSQITMINDKNRKIRSRSDEKGLPTNLDAYAAVDVHNISLIYLRQNLLEKLVDDAEKFHEKVVGSIVRIRLPSNDQKPDMHRLVRVAGTSKSTEPYNIGTKTTDVMLEILNLDKRELVSIDGISNQEFSQDECERLRQSTEFGLIKRFTVGEIQNKAMHLQAVKVNDWLEAEILRLTHLRDRASEKGHRKELRECVEKLQLLNSPEERKRRLEEVPVVNSDPKIDLSYEFDDNDDKVKPKKSGFSTKRKDPISSGQGSDVLINGGSSALNHSTTPIEQSKDNIEIVGINGLNTSKNRVDPTGTGIAWSNQAVVESDLFSDALEVLTLALSTGTNKSVNDFEIDKIWHYQDPTGKVQGPFSMLHLRKWSASGMFPQELRIWRVNEKQENSILLIDALTGQYCKEQLLPYNSHSPQQEVKDSSDGRGNDVDGRQNKSMNAIAVDGERIEESKNREQDDPSRPHEGNNEAVGSDGLGSHLSNCTTLGGLNSSEGHSGIFPEGWESLKGNPIWPNQPQVSSSLPTSVFHENQTFLHQISKEHGSERNSGQSNENITPDCQTRNNQVCENLSEGEGHSGQSSGQNWRPPVSSPSNGWDSKAGLNSVTKSFGILERNQEGIPNLSTSNQKPSHESSGQVAEKTQSPSRAPVQVAGVSWSTASSLVSGGAQLHEVAGDWVGYSPNPAKPSVEEWDSSLVSASSLKPAKGEIISDHAATPASISDQLTHSSSSHPQSNASSWHDLVPEPDEFSSLPDESVSDLLAEVEAMETLHRLSSPAIMSRGGELTEGSKTDCLSSVEEFSPAPEPGKGDALSSTADVILTPQSNVTDESHVRDNAGVINREKRSEGHPSVSVDVEVDAKHSDVSVNQFEATPEIQPSAPSTAGWDVAMTDVPWNARSESTNNWGAVPANADMGGWQGGLEQGNALMDWRIGQPTTQVNTSMNLVTPASTMGSYPRHGGGERLSSPRDRGFHVRDSGANRNRHFLHRQPFYGGGYGGSQSRPPPKGQRVCKFFESGFCKKGTQCSYWHP
ncbi:zinc finger CCCH domain-containing protein 44 isoform X2 [Humulus lupulus]|uniref:zinc finger CCCH domain-containing protein 44 isoform X2 n=1 Tax=Humulus lupulus TaxID=3486 RepID=UPI002B40B5E1|nr:zinc finger CCCH domain-containing protein 44 isoform X2 [Humulus lupulus]